MYPQQTRFRLAHVNAFLTSLKLCITRPGAQFPIDHNDTIKEIKAWAPPNKSHLNLDRTAYLWPTSVIPKISCLCGHNKAVVQLRSIFSLAWHHILVNTSNATIIGSLRNLKQWNPSAVVHCFSAAMKYYLAVFNKIGIDGQAAIPSRTPHQGVCVRLERLRGTEDDGGFWGGDAIQGLFCRNCLEMQLCWRQAWKRCFHTKVTIAFDSLHRSRFFCFRASF